MGVIDRDDGGCDDFDDLDGGHLDDEFGAREFDVRDHVQDTSVPCRECGGKGTVAQGINALLAPGRASQLTENEPFPSNRRRLA